MSVSVITHALVFYPSSGIKKTVALSAIVNFSPSSETDFVRTKKYKVWSDGEGSTKGAVLLNAHVLLLGCSEDDVCLKRERTRLKLPCVRNVSLTSDTSATAVKSRKNSKRGQSVGQVSKEKRCNVPKTKECSINKRTLTRYRAYVDAVDENVCRNDDPKDSSAATVVIERPSMESFESVKSVISGWCEGRPIVATSSRTRGGNTMDRESTVLEGVEPTSTATPPRQLPPSAKRDSPRRTAKHHHVLTATHTRSDAGVSPIQTVTPRSHSPRRRLVRRSIVTKDAVSRTTDEAERVPVRVRPDSSERSVGDAAAPRSNRSLRSTSHRPRTLERYVEGVRRRDRWEDDRSDASGAERDDPDDETYEPENHGEDDRRASPRRVPSPEAPPVNVEAPRERTPVRRRPAVDPNRPLDGRNVIRERNTPQHRINENLRERVLRAVRVFPRENTIRDMPQVCLYEGIYVNADTWDLMLSKSDSRFVKDVAYLLWGPEALAERCLDATRANKFAERHRYRREVTPDKYEAVKDCLHMKLTANRVTNKERIRRMRNVWRHMSTTIYETRQKRNDRE